MAGIFLELGSGGWEYSQASTFHLPKENVAQLDSARACEARGRRFESFHSHQAMTLAAQAMKNSRAFRNRRIAFFGLAPNLRLLI